MASDRPIEWRPQNVSASDDREYIARKRIESHQCRLQTRAPKTPETAGNGGFGRLQQRRFVEGDRARALAQQAPGHFLDTVRAAAKIDVVEIPLENLIFGEARFEQERQHGFLKLAADRPFIRQEQDARELLCERAAALQKPALADVVDRGARDRQWIESEMIVETAIFYRDRRLQHIRGNFRQP